MTLNPKDAPKDAEEEEEDDDLFGSDEEEEDPEAVRIREERLAAYKKKKEGKEKPAAKSIVTLDVKPWGMHTPHSSWIFEVLDRVIDAISTFRRRDRHERTRSQHARHRDGRSHMGCRQARRRWFRYKEAPG